MVDEPTSESGHSAAYICRVICEAVQLDVSWEANDVSNCFDELAHEVVLL